jgi:hypothetical protein
MSWTAYIPETPAGQIHDAIDTCPTDPAAEAELADGPKAQLTAARALAKDLIDSGVVKGASFEVTLGGHADPGDESTQPDCVHVQVTEVAAPDRAETPGHGWDERTKSFHADEEPAAATEVE